MNHNANSKLTKLSQKLRREMTKEEKKLWYDYLKGLSVPVYRQKVFDCYIADFYIARAKLIIELDGSQHYSEEGQSYDAERAEFFKEKGISVLRYSNYDIKSNFEGVCADIAKHIFGTKED